MPLHDIRYKHWKGAHLGLWRRRLVIASNGLTACLRNRWMQRLVVLCWGASLAMSLLLFVIGQLIVADSTIASGITHFNPGLQGFARLLTAWLEQHPEISVGTVQNVLFYFFCKYLLRGSIFALGMMIPILITRDLASNAIIIYSSKAVSRGDYLLGKFSTAFGLMALTWLGPVCAAWFFGNLLAPDWKFFWHSRTVLLHAVLFGLSSMTILSLLALGVSALSSREKTTSALWYVWWILGGVLAPIAFHTLPWLRHLSFNYNLEQVALYVFRLGDDLRLVQENIPIFSNMIRNVPPQTMEALSAPTFKGAVVWLLFMSGAALWIVRRRSKPE